MRYQEMSWKQGFLVCEDGKKKVFIGCDDAGKIVAIPEGSLWKILDMDFFKGEDRKKLRITRQPAEMPKWSFV